MYLVLLLNLQVGVETLETVWNYDSYCQGFFNFILIQVNIWDLDHAKTQIACFTHRLYTDSDSTYINNIEGRLHATCTTLKCSYTHTNVGVN